MHKPDFERVEFPVHREVQEEGHVQTKTKSWVFMVRSAEKKLEETLKGYLSVTGADPEMVYGIVEIWLSAMAESDEGLHPKTVVAVASVFRKVVTEYVQIRYKTEFDQLLELARRSYSD